MLINNVACTAVLTKMLSFMFFGLVLKSKSTKQAHNIFICHLNCSMNKINQTFENVIPHVTNVHAHKKQVPQQLNCNLVIAGKKF